MLLIIFIAIAFLEILLFRVMDKLRLGKWNWSLLILLVVLMAVGMPRLLAPPPEPDGSHCGMPIMAITMCSWIFGIPILLAAYYLQNWMWPLETKPHAAASQKSPDFP